MAAGLGNLRVANVIMLGALSKAMENQSLTDGRLSLDTWLKAVAERVPARYIELNQKAFLAGREIS
jgi:indolepyruvate ferredoxin oxidoreductase beta subunit